MKAKNRLAVGLTTALTLIAAFVWFKLDESAVPSKPQAATVTAPDDAMSGGPEDAAEPRATIRSRPRPASR